MRLRVIAAALLGGLAILSSTIATPAKEALKPRKIGVIIITLQSEVAGPLDVSYPGRGRQAQLAGHRQGRGQQSCGACHRAARTSQ